MKESTTWIVVIGCVAVAGMGFASISKDSQTAVLIGGFASSICVSILTYAQSTRTAAKQELASAKVDVASEKAGVAAEKAERTAVLVQENATFTDHRLEGLKTVALETQKTANAVYKLSNSAMGAALGLTAAMARRIADSPDGTALDESVAIKAEKDYADHMEKQRLVDLAPGGPPTHVDQKETP